MSGKFIFLSHNRIQWFIRLWVCLIPSCGWRHSEHLRLSGKQTDTNRQLLMLFANCGLDWTGFFFHFPCTSTCDIGNIKKAEIRTVKLILVTRPKNQATKYNNGQCTFLLDSCGNDWTMLLIWHKKYTGITPEETICMIGLSRMEKSVFISSAIIICMLFSGDT